MGRHGQRRATAQRVGRAAGITALLATTVLVTLTATQVAAAAINVTTTADVIDAGGSTCATVTIAALPGPNGVTSLREAVCAANNTAGNDAVIVPAGTYTLTGAANEDTGTSGDLDIDDGVTISGAGRASTIIDGGGIERIFDVFPAGPITFQVTDLTVQGGDVRSTSFVEGGAMYLHGGTVTTLTNVTVQNNFAGEHGAIESRGPLTLNNVVVTNNLTSRAGTPASGGGIHSSGGLTITNSTISNNTVGGNGGGISVTSSSMTITGSTISGNNANAASGGDANGGGISVDGGGIITATITNSTISGNRAAANGGGLSHISSQSGVTTLRHVTITDNRADSDDNGTGVGGGVHESNAFITARNSIIAGNTRSNGTTRDDIAGAMVASGSGNLVGDGTGMTGLSNGTNSNQVGDGTTPIPAQLNILGNNGGGTQTHSLQDTSPAINAGDTAQCLGSDQRGVTRPAGLCDIGAYELVDSTPPNTTITTFPANPTAGTSAPFQFTGSDTGGSGLAGFQCALDAGSFTACTSQTTYSGLDDGTHTFQVRAVDGAGNVDPSPASYTWVVDATAPDTGIGDVPPSLTSSTGNVFSLSGSDAGTGVDGFQCAIDGSGFGSCDSPWSLIGLSDGPHTVQARAVDAVGNVDPTPASYTWTIDSTAPDTFIYVGPPGPSSDPNPTFLFTGSDGATSYECSLDGDPFATCTSPQSLAGLADGTHTFEVRATDAAGNTDPTPASYTWTLDHAHGARLSATKTVAGTLRNGSTVTYTIVVTNTGSFQQFDGIGDEMTDVLPAALQLVNATATSGSVNTDATTGTVRWNGSLAAGASVTITITATVNAAVGSTISNQATVSFDSDENGSNESSAVSDNPSTGGVDATSFVVAPARNIPATGGDPRPLLTGAALLLAAGLALLGVRRRRAPAPA